MAGPVTLKIAPFPPFDSDDPLLFLDCACDSQAQMAAAGFTFPEGSPAVTCVSGSGFKFDQKALLNVTTTYGAAIAAEFSRTGTLSFYISRHALENKAAAGANFWVSGRAFTQTAGMRIFRVYDSGDVAPIALYNNTAASVSWIFRFENDALLPYTANAQSSDGYSDQYDPDYAHIVCSWSGNSGVLYRDGHFWKELNPTDALAVTRDLIAFGEANLCPHDAGASASDPVYIKDVQASIRPILNQGDRRPGLRIAFFGDSNTERGGTKTTTDREYGYMEDIKGRFRALGMNVHYFNHGNSGHHWSDTRSAADLAGVVSTMLADKPDIVVAFMSVNDFYNGAPTADLETSIEGILTTINADSNVRKILFVTNFPITQGDPAVNSYADGGTNEIVRTYQDQVNETFWAATIPAKCERYDLWTALGGHNAPVEYAEGARGYGAPNSTQVHITRVCQMATGRILFNELLRIVNAL